MAPSTFVSALMRRASDSVGTTGVVVSACVGRKIPSLADLSFYAYHDGGAYDTETEEVRVVGILPLSHADFDRFCSDFMALSQVAVDCNLMLSRAPVVDPSFQDFVAVVDSSDNRVVLVDPEGYAYARYVALPM